MNLRLRMQLAWLLALFLITPCWSQSKPANAWQVKLVGQLREHLHIPPDLSDRIGEVWVDFTIDRSGFIKSTKLIRSAGVPELDKAVLAAIEAAQPFSVPPGADDSVLTIPVTFGFPAVSPAASNFDEEKLVELRRGEAQGTSEGYLPRLLRTSVRHIAGGDFEAPGRRVHAR
jgi:TonB family protein